MATTTLNIEKPDEAIIAHAEWQRQEHAVRTAYRAWCDAERPERTCRCAAYVAQLDLEQLAAESYAAALRRVRTPHPAGGPPSPQAPAV